jgi:hypothetical protein
VSQLGFRVVLKLVYYVMAYLGYKVADSLGFCAPTKRNGNETSNGLLLPDVPSPSS